MERLLCPPKARCWLSASAFLVGVDTLLNALTSAANAKSAKKLDLIPIMVLDVGF